MYFVGDGIDKYERKEVLEDKYKEEYFSSVGARGRKRWKLFQVSFLLDSRYNTLHKNKWRNMCMSLNWKWVFISFLSIQCKRSLNCQQKVQVQSKSNTFTRSKFATWHCTQGKYYNCQIQMIKRCLNLIHKSSSFVSQVEADSQDGTIGLHTHMTWFHPQMHDSQMGL